MDGDWEGEREEGGDAVVEGGGCGGGEGEFEVGREREESVVGCVRVELELLG